MSDHLRTNKEISTPVDETTIRRNTDRRRIPRRQSLTSVIFSVNRFCSFISLMPFPPPLHDHHENGGGYGARYDTHPLSLGSPRETAYRAYDQFIEGHASAVACCKHRPGLATFSKPNEQGDSECQGHRYV